MGKQSKRLLAMFLALMMVVSTISFDTKADPISDAVEAAEEAADEVTKAADVEEDSTEATDDTKQEKSEAKVKKSSAKKAEAKVDDSDIKIDTSELTVGNAMAAAVNEEMDEDDIDMSDPEIQAVAQELDDLEVQAEGEKEKTPLTEDQKQAVIVMYNQYLQQRTENADVLGVQAPFYLQYNDNDEDGLGILGEMLVLAGVTVDQVRSGDYTYDNLIGMIQNFLYGDQFGIQYYGTKVKEQRDAALKAVEESGAKTQMQKLLVLNDWLAQQDTFDMAYIMNQKDENGNSTASLVAEEPVKNEHYDEMYKEMYNLYYDNVYAQIKAYVRQQYYDNCVNNGMSAEDAEKKADEYVESDDAKADIEKNAKEQTEGAAAQLTEGIIGYWQGTQFGALALGSSVCMGYSKAYTYLVQCMDAGIYTNNGKYEDASDWKTTQELYYDENGNIDIDKGYTVDMVRITFNAKVTMYGETKDNFASDHFWNAVRVDGKWYYVDPCYTDVYTEVMSRDRVEVNGSMNHLYFMFSDTTARSLYKDNFSELKSLYKDVATDTSYEDAWFSRIKSNTYTDGTSAYYSYDSTDLIAMMNQYGDMGGITSQANNNSGFDMEMDESEYKIVKHDLSKSDDDDGDTDYDALIEFNYKENEDDDTSVARVYNPETKAMEENKELTKAFAEYADQAVIYPSIALTMVLKDGVIYFNLANKIYSYDEATGKVVLVKEYNEVNAKRDKTVAFGGMAFSVVDEAGDDTLSVENAPIAGMTLKPDGNLYVDIATKYAFISGKEDINDTDSYGYEFQESNYNPNYNSYYNDKLGQYGREKEVNDNDEFMWTANFTDTISMSKLTGSHDYEKVSVEATCGRDAYTENRCKDCGAIEDGSRVYAEGTADDHHYVHFDEQYYTKDSNGNWNKGDCYVCTVCGYAVESDDDGTDDDWDDSKDTYEMAKAKAGHVYVPTDDAKVEWAEDNKSVTITDSDLTCDTCSDKKLDCLIGAEDLTIKGQTVTLSDVKVTTVGTCDEGVTTTYTATGKTDDGKAVEATKVVKQEAGKHTYEATFTWADPEDGVYKSAKADLKCAVESCGKELKDQEAVITSEEKKATCEEDGQIVYTATVTPEDGNTVTDTKTVKTEDKLGHDYTNPVFTWAEDNKSATAEFTCTRCEDKKTVDAEVVIDKDKSTEPTCTEAGTVVYVATATLDDKDYTDTKTVEEPKTAHPYELDFKWSETEEGSVTVKAVCKACGDTKNFSDDEVTVSEPVITDATYTKAGSKVYTATVTLDGKEYSDTYSVAIPKLDANARMSKSSTSIYATASTKLTLKSDYVDDKITSATTSNKSYATVSVAKDGKSITVKAVKARSATTSITVKTASKETVKVKVTTKKPSVKLTATSAPLQVKKSTSAIKVKSKISTDSISKVSSSKTSVATVKKTSSTGLKVTAKSKTGTATIKVTMKSGATATCKVKVQKSAVKVTSVSVPDTKVTLRLAGKNKKKTYTIKATRKPVTATSKITYTSSNKKVATVSSSGKITAKKKGTATITVKSGTKTKKIKVTVKSK